MSVKDQAAGGDRCRSFVRTIGSDWRSLIRRLDQVPRAVEALRSLQAAKGPSSLWEFGRTIGQPE